MGKKSGTRAFELDVIRGFSIFMMMLMHFAYDIRYIFGLDAFAFLEGTTFWVVVHPLFLVFFVGVSGICCTFSRSNFKRGIKLTVIALLETLITAVATYYFGFDCLIIFNVLHLLALGILVYAAISFCERVFKWNPKTVNVWMAVIGLWIIVIGGEIEQYDGIIKGMWLSPLGIFGSEPVPVADYLAIFPWLGVFLIGAIIGRVCYSDKTTLIPNTPKFVRKLMIPFEFLGKHSLIVYIVHQPIVLGLTYLILKIIGLV